MTSPRYWLFKSEPDVFSIHDLAAAKGKRTSWEGVRNYQVRNMLRDEMRVGDGVLFYHSRVNPMVIAGTAEIVKAGYPDHFAQDPQHKYFDEASSPNDPRWYMVDIRLVTVFPKPVTRDELKAHPVTSKMAVMSKGSRLSITPVTPAEWSAVHELANITDR
ncbi:MAG: EVE domain-containing protein [Planctomycetaceae bacterium]